MPNPVKLSASPTADTSAYASGDLIGGKLSFKLPAGNGAYYVQSVSLVDQAKQAAPLDLYLFDADPTDTTFTDQSAFDVADADLGKVAGVAPITTYYALNDNTFGFSVGLAMPVIAAASMIYGALVSRGTPTYAAATDVKVVLRLVPA